MDAAAWPAPSAAESLTATVALPGSKSLTNRLAILAALSQTPTTITAPLRARDTNLMADAINRLGAHVEATDTQWRITAAPLVGADIDCGLSGTVMRFVPPVAALATGVSRFDGDPHARTRPMRSLLEGLRQLGVDVIDDGRGVLPFTVVGAGSVPGGVPGGVVELDASASSQFVSGLLLTGARFRDGVEIRHIGQAIPSMPHIDMTVSVLADAGVLVDTSTPNRWIVSPGVIDLPDVVVEPDLSNAAAFLAAALVCGGSVTVPHWPSKTDQAGAALPQLLQRMGAQCTLSEAGLTVTGTGMISPLVEDLHDVGELTPVIAALCALADGESRLTGIGHIRHHETDRLAALAHELSARGCEVTELPDGLIITPAPMTGGLWHSYADHRMAHAGAVIGLAVPGVLVEDIACTTKTMADFPGLWFELLAQVEVRANGAHGTT